MTGRRVDIGVCTFQRPEVAETLRSIAALASPAGCSVRVVVADNDDVPSAHPAVQRLAGELKLDLRYVHAPARNISVARNACLDAADGDFLAFVDDDETVSADWLRQLLEVADATGAAVVLGPVEARYADDAPHWMRQGDFHSTAPVWVGGEIRTGYAGNTLLRVGAPSVRGKRFDVARGRTGGEDTVFLDAVFRAGGKIAFAPLAFASEPVSPSRATFRWLAKRRFRAGQTHGHLLRSEAAFRGREFVLALLKLAYCLGASALMSGSPLNRRRNLLRGILHAGVLSGIVGRTQANLYGADNGVLEGRRGL